MQRAIKIRLIPTPEQEILFIKSCGAARWAYNFYIAEKERVYKEWKECNSKPKFISEQDVRKYINNVLKPTEEYKWLKEVGSNVMKQAVKDADFAYQRFFKHLADKPKFKKKDKCKLSFYVNYESLVRTQNGFRGEKIGVVKTSEPLPKLDKSQKYSNPRISFDGRYWYLSVGVQIDKPKDIKLSDESLGIDLGVKELAVCSNDKFYHNINKTKTIKNLKKRLRRAERSLARMLINNTDHYEPTFKSQRPIYKKDLNECPNIKRQKKIISLIHKRINDIRHNYIHQTTREIVKTKPSQIVMETLNIKGLMKNKHLARYIQENCWYEFKRQIKYKSEEYGIKLIEVDRFYPSSKMCSCCGNVKKELPLKVRTYRCEECGLIIDRDYNASINLANYK